MKKKKDAKKKAEIVKNVKPIKPDKKKKQAKPTKPAGQLNNDKKNKSSKTSTIAVFIAIVLLVCLLFHSLFSLISKNESTYVVRYGNISKEESLSGLVIREESMVTVPENQSATSMQKIITEGKRIAEGENVYKFYTKDESDINKQISDLNTQIQNEIANSDEKLVSIDTKLYDEQITAILKKISGPNDIQTIEEYKKNLDELMSKKAQEMGKISSKDSKLKNLVNQKNELQKQLDQASQYIKSSRSGIVSYRIDGLEEQITCKDLSIYNERYINSLNLTNGQIISSVENKGKIVNNFISYVAVTSKSEEAQHAKLKQKVYLELPNGKVINARVVQINSNSEKSKTIILKINQGIEDLLIYRKVNFNVIWWNDSGFKIPNSSIIEVDGLNYVIKTRNGYTNSVLVKLNNQSDYYSIVSNYSTSEIKELRGVMKGANTTLTLYDELLTKPTEADISRVKN